MTPHVKRFCQKTIGVRGRQGSRLYTGPPAVLGDRGAREDREVGGGGQMVEWVLFGGGGVSAGQTK